MFKFTESMAPQVQNLSTYTQHVHTELEMGQIMIFYWATAELKLKNTGTNNTYSKTNKQKKKKKINRILKRIWALPVISDIMSHLQKMTEK